METINEDERYTFYQKPNGYHLYRREETEDGIQEIPVFSHYSGAVLHNREVLTDSFDMEKPTQDMKRALGFIEKQAEAIREHGEESKELAEAEKAFNAYAQELDERETGVVMTVLQYVSQSEDFQPELETINNLVEWGEVPEDVSVEGKSEEEETVDLDKEDEDDDEVIDID